MTDYDIAVVGAGPAGAALASVLAPRYRVLVLDRVARPVARIGESLIPAARRLLRDMGMLEAFEAQGYAPYLGNRSFWGGAEGLSDFIRDPDGPGWHLDRAGFETFMRKAALARGARVIAPAKLGSIRRDGTGWRVQANVRGRDVDLSARLLVDAGGRAAPLAKQMGAVRQNTDRTVAYWLRGRDTGVVGDAGFSTVESEKAGWWYTAPLGGQPGGHRVLAFHTDPDLVAGDGALMMRAQALPGIGAILREAGFRSQGKVMTTAANSARLSQFSGQGWLAIGDAALSFDPLASRGLFHALYTGFSGAACCDAVLQGQTQGFDDYAADLERITQAYDRHLSIFYGSEARWQGAPFWHRRQVNSEIINA